MYDFNFPPLAYFSEKKIWLMDLHEIIMRWKLGINNKV